MSAGGPRADPVTPGPELAARTVAYLLGCLASSTPTPAQSGLLSGSGSWWRLRGASQVQVRADGGSPGLWEVCVFTLHRRPLCGGCPPALAGGECSCGGGQGASTGREAPAVSLGGRSCGNGTWFPDASLHPPSELVWSRRCLEEAGPRAAGGGRKAEGVAADPAVGPVLQQKGLSSPCSRGLTQTPAPEHASCAAWGCVRPRPLFLCQDEETFMADGSVSGPCKHLSWRAGLVGLGGR